MARSEARVYICFERLCLYICGLVKCKTIMKSSMSAMNTAVILVYILMFRRVYFLFPNIKTQYPNSSKTKDHGYTWCNLFKGPFQGGTFCFFRKNCSLVLSYTTIKELGYLDLNLLVWNYFSYAKQIKSLLLSHLGF